MRLFYRLLILIVFIGLVESQVAQAQRTLDYQYMHIFYYGKKATVNTPILSYSPAFKGKKEVKIQEPEFLVKLYTPFAPGRVRTPGKIISSTTSTPEGMWVTDENGNTRKTDPQQEAQRDANQQIQYMQALARRTELIQDALTQAVNNAAADGWEVVQAAPGENEGLVYLLRKLK